MEEIIKDLNPTFQLLVLMAILTFLPLVFVTMTSFLRFIIVFSILKTALGTQQVPPGMVIIGLSMILTFYTMSSVFTDSYNAGYKPYKQTGSIVSAIVEGSEPLKMFMMKQTRQKDLAFFIEARGAKPPATPADINIFDVAPAYIMSELKTSFEIGFIIFIPFIVIDLIVANILLALGMFMLSPTIISLPFKLLIFIAVDGWSLIVNGLVQSFN
ncbi:MAG TPA: flagellar type III secretion system pore protein FliP [Candidatus Gastranaerophilales bacterium]|nr:flagellar type III secretion system pore protein FliP [Candidatus Gastranaerophilales bacterium]